MSYDLEHLAARSGRVVTAAALERAGIGRNDVARLRRAGLLVRLLHRTYAVPPVTEPPFELACRAGVTYAGREAVVLGEAALAYGSTYPRPDAVEVGVPRERHVRSTSGLTVARCADAFLDGARDAECVRVQEAGRAVAWAWSRLTREEDRQAVVCAAAAAGVGLAQVRRAVGALPRLRGRTTLLETCDHVAAGCASPAEIAYLLAVERPYGLPPGQRQVPVDVPGGRRRRVDVRYGRVVVEIDGAHHRLGRAQREDDAVRDVVLRALGLHVVRVDAADVARAPGLVAATVRAALADCA